jgi:AcrR family transcriptional regulator
MARPRSERAHTDVLDGALALFAERGIEATTMDAIAEASGVSKATIYKHWPDKDALSLEVMARLHGRETVPPDPDSGNLRADLIAVLGYEPPRRNGKLQSKMMPHLLAYAASRPEFSKAWQARVLEPPRLQLARVLDRAVALGRLPPDLDRDLAIALLMGPLLYKNVLRLVRGRVPPRLTELVVDAFLASHRVRRRGTR